MKNALQTAKLLNDAINEAGHCIRISYIDLAVHRLGSELLQLTGEEAWLAGALVLSEKIRFPDAEEQQRNDMLHHDFTRAQGYSDMEIAQKRTALDNVLVPDTLDEHIARLRAAGFTEITPWFRCFNFLSIIARTPAGEITVPGTAPA